MRGEGAAVNITYFDYAATAPIRPEAAAAMMEALGQFGNPSSQYPMGVEMKAAVER